MQMQGFTRVSRGNVNANANARRKIQVPSVPCQHGTVQNKMAPTLSAISEEKFSGSERKFPVFLDKSLPNFKEETKVSHPWKDVAR